MNFNKRPVYTFGKRTYATSKSLTPGPNQYDVRTKLQGGYSFGREFRSINTTMQDKYNTNPGVGSYGVNKNLGKEAPNYTFGGSGIEKSGYYNHSENKPGPGNYNPKPMFKSLAYSIGGKHNNGYGDNSDEPGPGAYLKKSDVSKYSNRKFNAPEYSFGGSRKDVTFDPLKGNRNPGPGTYDRGDDNTIKKKAPNFSFPHEDRDPNDTGSGGAGNRFTPGPGDYDPSNSANYHFNEAPHYSLGNSSGQNYTLNNSSKIPGPGSYTLNDKNKKRYPGVVIGNEPRIKCNDNSNPGPGSYRHTNIEVQKQSAPKFR
jgi:hypothetical protein